MLRRILFVGNGVTLAHICRPLQLAHRLDPHRYEVHFACDVRYRPMLESLVGQFHAIHTQDSCDFLAALAEGRPPYSSATLCTDAEEDLNLLDEVQPDLVVADFRLSMRIATTLRHIPYATITNTHWSPYFRGRYRLPDMPNLWPARIIGARRMAQLAEVLLPPMFARYAWPMTQARRKFGLPSLGMRLQRVYTEADHVLYAEAEEMNPMVSVPTHHHFIGPIVWEPPIHLPYWWNALPDDCPLIYVSMGSSGSIDLLPTIVQGLANLPVCVVLSTAGRTTLQNLPDNVHTADYLPGSRVASLAALVIGNGGSMMLHQCLKVGVPMLAIPSNMDQQMTIAPFVARNAVRELRLASVSPASIRDSVMTMLSSTRYYESSKDIAQVLASYDPTERFASFLNTLFGANSAPVAATNTAVNTIK